MRNLYEYKGSISSISGSGEIVLCVFGNDEIPRTVPKALFQYISDVSGADSEEKYYEKIFKYDRILNLQEIVIPSKDNGVPAKIITQSKLTSEKAAIFGEVEQMETPEKELEPMSNEEYNRYFEFRREHNHDKFYYA